MLPLPLEAPGCLLFLSHADRPGGNSEVAVHCRVEEARLPWGGTCSANCWGERDGVVWGGHGGAWRGVRSEA